MINVDSLVMRNLRIESNVGVEIHGAVYINKGAGNPLLIQDIVLYNNTAYMIGAGLLV